MGYLIITLENNYRGGYMMGILSRAQWISGPDYD